MFLFIFESIGTQELVLIGIIALIFLGPRKLPEYAKKIGKIMAEFRGTASEFKQTWEREVNFEEETRSLRIDTIEQEAESKPAAVSASDNVSTPVIAPPAIRQIEPADMPKPASEPAEMANEPEATKEPQEDVHAEQLEKHNWL